MATKKKRQGLEKRKAISGYLFISPFIIGFLAFMVKPLFQSLYMSFCEVDLHPGGFTFTWAGISNYYRAFRVDPEFTQFLGEELGRMAYNSFAIIVFSLFVAMILNQEFKGRGLVRAVFFLPVILSSGVIVGIESSNTLLASINESIEESGAGTSITTYIENILVTTGVASKPLELLFEVIDGIYDVALASGIQIIIFLSGLQTIPKSSYEAAQIEGCTAWESFWKITFPLISPLFLVCWVYTLVDFCMRSDNEIIEKIRNTMVGQIKYGFASSMAWIYFVIVMAIIGLSSFIISKWVYYDD